MAGLADVSPGGESHGERRDHRVACPGHILDVLCRRGIVHGLSARPVERHSLFAACEQDVLGAQEVELYQTIGMEPFVDFRKLDIVQVVTR
jgi:hypothetical protein